MKVTSRSTPPARMWPSWRAWAPRNHAPVGPFTDQTYRSSPWRTTHTVTGARSVPSRRSDATSSSSAAATVSSSPLAHESCVMRMPIQTSVAPRLLRVWLIVSLRAVADPPDVAVGVCERTAVPAPLQLRRGLEDLGAGLLCFVHHLVNPFLAANDVVQGQAGEAAALRVHADIGREAFAPVEADERPPVRDEEHRDLVVVLDLPAEAFRVEALRCLHVIDAQKDRAHVRIHFAPPI